MIPLIVAIGIFLFALILLIVVWMMSKKRVLRGPSERKIREVWMLTEQIADPSRRILEADKVLDTALSLLGYEGTLGEKLKKAGPRFHDLNGLWNAHKLRNSVAHDLHVHIGEAQAAQAMRAFREALRDLGIK